LRLVQWQVAVTLRRIVGKCFSYLNKCCQKADVLLAATLAYSGTTRNLKSL